MDVFLIGMAVLLGYFLPGIVAKSRKHHNSDAILLLNLLLGWTGIGWIAALIWAFTAARDAAPSSSNSSSAGAPPQTQVRCPDCRELVRMDARKCKHCGTALVPQGERLRQPRPDDVA